MSALALFVLLLVVTLPIVWFFSEFQWGRGVRLTLGVLAILCSFGVAFVVGSLDRLNSNAWFGGASKRLVDTTVSELEAGHTEQVMRSLRKLQAEFHPTYENRARYDKLVDEAVADMQKTKQHR